MASPGRRRRPSWSRSRTCCSQHPRLPRHHRRRRRRRRASMTKGMHEGPAFTPDQLHDRRRLDHLLQRRGRRRRRRRGQADDRAVHAVDDGDEHHRPRGARPDAERRQGDLQRVRWSAPRSQLTNLQLVAPASTRRACHASGLRHLGSEPDADAGSDRQLLGSRRDGLLGTTSAALGPGTLVLPNFAAGDLISVVFRAHRDEDGLGRRGHRRAARTWRCSWPTSSRCWRRTTARRSCHIGGAPTAGLKWDTTPDAALCVVALSEINTTTPAQSQLLLQPDPAQNNGHPQKINPITAFSTAVTNWINAEK